MMSQKEESRRSYLRSINQLDKYLEPSESFLKRKNKSVNDYTVFEPYVKEERKYTTERGKL